MIMTPFLILFKQKHLSSLFFQILLLKPGVVAHACNPSTWEAETGGSGFAASLSYLVKPPQLTETLFQNKK